MTSVGQPHSRGQILVIFAGGLVVLLLIASLVIDLGFTFMLRRQEQNAADPGAIAAARYIRPAPNMTLMTEAACFYARQNGFFPNATDNDSCLPANDPNGTTLTVNYPPSAGAGTFSGRDGFVEVVITRQQQTFIGGVVGLKNINVVSSAVAAFSQGDSNSNSLIALDPGDCKTGWVTGNTGTSTSNLKVTVGGSVHVNSNCPVAVSPPVTAPCAGSGNNDALVVDGGAGLSTTAQVYTVGSCSTNGSGTITTGTSGSAVNQGAVVIGDPLGELQPPSLNPPPAGQSCGGGTPTDASTNNGGCGTGGQKWVGTPCTDNTSITCVTLNPGVYYGGWSLNNGAKVRLLLNPGIYLMAGGGIRQNGGEIDDVLDASGNTGHVLIYSSDNPLYATSCAASWTNSATCQGPLNLGAQGSLKIYGLDQATCTAIASTCPYVGMLLWQDGKGSCPTSITSGCGVSLGGGASMDIAGTIYAPDQLVTLAGSSVVNGTATVQIISWAWKITGNSSLYMPYDPNQLYHFDQKGLVH